MWLLRIPLFVTVVTFAYAQLMTGSGQCGKSYQAPPLLSKVNKLMSVEKRTWPWIIPIYRYNRGQQEWEHVCSGTIIEERWVLTAAHCLIHEQMTGRTNPRNGHPMKARLIAKNKALYRVPVPGLIFNTKSHIQAFQGFQPQLMIPLSRYTGKKLDMRDLMLIKLQQTLTWTPFRQPICLTDVRDLFQSPNGSYKCFAAGWGPGMRDSKANWLNVDQQYGPVFHGMSQYCMLQWGFQFGGKVPDFRFCFGHGERRQCATDKGSPLMCKLKKEWVMVGVVNSDAEEDCIDERKPAVFLEIAHYLTEIRNIIKAN